MTIPNAKNKKQCNTKSHENTNASFGCGICAKGYPKLDEFFGILSKDTTFQGVKHIGSRHLHPIERFFWMFITLICLLFGIYLVYRVYAKYHDSPVIISFQTEETPISNIPFPAITICNVNLLKRSVYTKMFDECTTTGYAWLFLNKTSLNKELEDSLVKNFMIRASQLDHLAQFCFQAPSFRRQINASLRDATGREDLTQKISGVVRNTANTNPERISDAEKIQRDQSYKDAEKKVFGEVMMNCEDMLLKCIWAGTLFPCKDFYSSVTRQGVCCSFNMMPRSLILKISPNDTRAQKDQENLDESIIQDWRDYAHQNRMVRDPTLQNNAQYPKYQRGGGRQYGLTILVNPMLHEYSTCTTNDGQGFKILAHSSLSLPNVLDYGAAIPPNHEVFVNVDPQVTIDDETELRDIPIDKRGCYLPNDDKSKLSHFNYYSAENCFSECWAIHTWRNCSCVQYFMPKNSTYNQYCGATRRTCAEAVLANITKNIGKDSVCDHCLPPCEEILYRIGVSHFDLRKNDMSKSIAFTNSKGEIENATDYSIVHIYMGTDSVYAKERKLLYSSITLISNAGGLLCLALGVSLISFLELFYLVTVRAFFRFRSMTKDTEDKASTSNKKRNEIFHIKTLGERRRSSRVEPSSMNGSKYYNWTRSRMNSSATENPL